MHIQSVDIVPSFSILYHACRKKEARIYDDQVVRNLPGIPSSHPHYPEWQERKKSYNRLKAYLNQKKKPLRIVDIGSGNSWMAASLAENPDWTVTAVDTTGQEIEQAQRVFGDRKRLSILEGDFCELSFPSDSFDIILFAASLQYFSDLNHVIETSRSLLNKAGEILIMDTFFYPENGLNNAKERSESYYRRLGMHEMSAYYHHHSLEALLAFEARFLFNPAKPINRLLKLGNFPLISIPT